ncbi:MAG: hypothetical protein WCX77_02900 [Candidatus Paceibacterota bacterium]|jgi:hypothetical protein
MPALSLNIFAILILISTIFSLFLGLLVFSKDPKKQLNRIFGAFGIITAVWNFTNFMSAIEPEAIWVKLAYGIGAFVPAFGVFWSLALCNKKLTKLKVFIYLAPAAILLFVSIAGDLLIKNAENISAGGSFKGVMGPAMPFMSAYYLFAAGTIIYILASSYLKAEGNLRKQILYILLGGGIWSTFTAITSFILPLFGITAFASLDSVTVIILLIFTTLGIARSSLFGIKVVLTEILVGIMGTILLVVPFFMPNTGLKILMALIFIFFSFIGYILVQYARKEEKMKEMLEQKVNKNTEELSLNKEELEKFYRLTIGREVRMAELKEKIKELGGK